MALTPAAFTDAILLEARETHPWLHHPLFHMIWDGKLARADRAATAEAQARGRLVMRRAITARRICADGMLEAFAGSWR